GALLGAQGQGEGEGHEQGEGAAAAHGSDLLSGQDHGGRRGSGDCGQSNPRRPEGEVAGPRLAHFSEKRISCATAAACPAPGTGGRASPASASVSGQLGRWSEICLFFGS